MMNVLLANIMFSFLSQKISEIAQSLAGSKTVSKEQIESAENFVVDLLIEADAPIKVAKNFASKIKTDLEKVKKDSKVDFKDRLKTAMFKNLVDLLGGEQSSDTFNLKLGDRVLFQGLQGAGKTTSIAKLIKNSKIPVQSFYVTSLDFVRPAAIQQLEVLISRVGANFVAPVYGDISKTLENLQKESSAGKSVLVVDTPGRLNIDKQLMSELTEISLIYKPTVTFLVLDGMTGQESLVIAKDFDKASPVTGAILSKMDSDSRGGVALSFYSELQKPVLFLGTGEALGDFERFVPNRVASRIMGGGDLETLMEKVEKELAKESSAEDDKAIEKKIKEGTFTLKDFVKQMDMISSLGPLESLIGYLPGMSQLPKGVVQEVKNEQKRLKAMINSMTNEERDNPSVLNSSRKKRIAKGSGLEVVDIDKLLNKFEQSKQFAKMMYKGGRNWPF